MTMTPAEWRYWRLDQRINGRGLPIDLDLVEAALDLDAKHRERLIARALEITGVENPNSRDQVLAWLRDNDVSTDTLRKADVVRLLGEGHDAAVVEVLEIRRELSKTSIKKFEALKRATCADGRLRGAFQFNGAARTGRWAGRLFQPQNLPRGVLKPRQIPTAIAVVKTRDYDFARALYPNLSDVLSSLVRAAIAPPPGKKLVVADFSSIETVMVAWASNCEPLLDVFREGRDAYKEMAVALFDCGYDEVTKDQRQYTKPIVLGCVYYLGAAGLVEYAKGYGVEMSPEQAERAVGSFRATYPEVVDFWHRLMSAAVFAVKNRRAARVGRFMFDYDAANDFLLLHLPSGRALVYPYPRVEAGRFGGETFTYEGVNQYTRKWTRLDTHGGKLTENIVQAISRDLLAAALERAEDDEALEGVGHVHDEILALADENDETALDRLLGYMRQLPAWAEGAPVNAAGWSGDFYRKD